MSHAKQTRAGRTGSRFEGRGRRFNKRTSDAYHRRPLLEALEQRRLLTSVTGVDPLPGTHEALVTTDISAVFDSDINPATVSAESFAVHGSQTGRRIDPPNTLSVVSDTVTLTPATPFHPGELVQVTATTGIESLSGDGADSPFVWQFRVNTASGTGSLGDSGKTIGDSPAPAVALGDLDGDGDLDAFLGDAGSPSTALSVWANDGHAEFTDTGQRLGGVTPSAVALGDLDGDGDLDAFVGKGRQNANQVWLNNGNGQFTNSGQALGDSPTTNVALGDVDGDGDLDAIVTNGEYYYSMSPRENKIWLNDGSGSFSDSRSELGVDGRSLATGDLDGDGDLDVMIGHFFYRGPMYDVWINDSSGGFTRVNLNQDIWIPNPAALALGDLDNDGDLDAFIGGSGLHFEGPFPHPSAVILNDGTGNFTNSGQSLGSAQTSAVALGDLDADGDLDALLANGGPGDFNTVWINDGSGGFSESMLSRGFFAGSAIDVGDLDGDGDLDGLVGSTSGNRLWLNADRNADVAVTVTDEVYSLQPGEQVAYTITVSNSGPDDVDAVTLTDMFPQTITEVTWSCTPTTGSICSTNGSGDIVDTGSLLAGGRLTYAATGAIAATASGRVINTARVSLPGGLQDISLANNTFSDVDVIPPLNISPPINSNTVPIGTSVTVAYPQDVRLSSVSDDTFFVHGSLSGQYVVPPNDLTLNGNLLSLTPERSFQPGELVHVTSTALIQHHDGSESFPAYAWQFRAGVGAGTGQGSGFLIDSGQRLGASTSTSVSLGDVDGDGDLDAIVSSFSGVRIWLSDQGVFFDTGRELGESYDSVSLGDLDGDGDLDTISDHRVWRNSGSGEFDDEGQLPSSGSSPILGDIDGDGDLDLLWIVGRRVALLINDGNGVFSDSGKSFANSHIAKIALEDFDGDGDLDVFLGVSGTHAGGPMPDEVWLNDGSGQFYDSGQRLGRATSDSLAIGDVDADGDTDVITASASSFVFGPPGATLWLNDGRGRFTQSTQEFGVLYISDVALGDVDGDGDLDLVSSRHTYGQPDDQANTVWLNNGNATFVDSDQRLDSAPTEGVALGDLDGNGTLDVFFANEGPDEVWFNTGNSADLAISVTNEQTAVSPGQNLVYAVAITNHGPEAVVDASVSIDFPEELGLVTWSCSVPIGSSCTENGRGDVAETISLLPNAMAVYTAQGSLTTSARGRLVTRAEVTPPVGVDDVIRENNTAIDIDVIPPAGFDPQPNSHDASLGTQISVTFLDLIEPSTVTDATYVIHGTQSGQLLQPANTINVVGETATLITAQPFHPGELVEVTTTNAIENQDGVGNVSYVWQFRTATRGGSSEFLDGGQIPGQARSAGIALGDLDGDHDLDAFVTNIASDANDVWLNDGSGLFSPTGQALGNSPDFDVALGDLDGDGDLDAFVVGSHEDTVWLNDGHAVFSQTDQALGESRSSSVALHDLDGDGDLDAFVSNDGANHVWLNQGDASFVDFQAVGSSNSQSVAIGDLDGDGDLDAFVANTRAFDRVWLNLSDGRFVDSGQELGTEDADSQSTALGDLDADGDLDAVVATNGTNIVWLNDGFGTFSRGRGFGGSNSDAVELGDVDSDGDLDAFVANDFEQPDRVWLNDGRGNLSDTGQRFGRVRSLDLALGDLDGDGDLDAIIANFMAPNMIWLNLGPPLIAGDINLDGNVNGLDVGPFVDVLLNGTNDPTVLARADMDQSGEVNGLDVDPFVAAVVGNDFLAWQISFGITMGATRSDGDADHDGDVDGDDFLIRQASFGTGSTAGGASAALPARSRSPQPRDSAMPRRRAVDETFAELDRTSARWTKRSLRDELLDDLALFK